MRPSLLPSLLPRVTVILLLCSKELNLVALSCGLGLIEEQPRKPRSALSQVLWVGIQSQQHPAERELSPPIFRVGGLWPRRRSDCQALVHSRPPQERVLRAALLH